MSLLLHEIFSAREYLKTYYPSDFNQKDFLFAIQRVGEEMQKPERVFDIGELSQKIALPSEAIENAAIFYFLQTVARRLLAIFPRGDATLLDVGGGPTIYQHIPLCLNVAHIIHADFLLENQEEVRRYLAGDASSYFWKNYYLAVQKILREDEQYQSLLSTQMEYEENNIREHARSLREILFSGNESMFEARLKCVIGENVISCDVFSPTLEARGESALIQALRRTTAQGIPNIISAHFLVESATEGYKQWEQGVVHLIERLSLGGCFIMTAIRNASWYKVGTRRVPAVSINEQILKKFLEEHGIVVEDIQVLVGSDKKSHGYDGMVFVFGRKTTVIGRA